MRERRAPRSVVVVYPHLPHYRFGVFEELQAGPLTVSFAAGPTARGGIETIPESALERTIPLRNRWLGRALWQGGLWRLVTRSKTDCFVLLGDASVLSYWIALVVLRLRRKPAYLWTIGWHRPERGVRRLARIAFYRLSTGLLLYGDVGREIGAALGYPEARMHVIGNSAHSRVSDEKVQRNPALAPLVDELAGGATPVIGAVIRLSPQKRLELIIDAAAELKREGREVIVLIAGEGPCRTSLERRAAASGVDLRLPGAIYAPEDIEDVYRLLAVTVVPQTAGLTTIQSMSHGVPVVSDDDQYTQAPEWEAILPGRTGSHYRPGDAPDLARAIRPWLDLKDDARTATADACRSEIELRWTPKVHARRIEAAILEDARRR